MRLSMPSRAGSDGARSPNLLGTAVVGGSGSTSVVGHSSGVSSEWGDEGATPMKERVAMLEELLRQSTGAPGGGKMSSSGQAAFGQGGLGGPNQPQRQLSMEIRRQVSSEVSPPGFGGGKGSGGSIEGGSGGFGGSGGKVPGVESGKGGKGGKGGKSAATAAEPPVPAKGKGKAKGAPPKPPPKVAASAKAGAKVGGPKPRKADVKPRMAMKRLFWNSFVLDEQTLSLSRGTVWNAIEEDGIEGFDTEELENMFGDIQSGRRNTLIGQGVEKKKVRPRVRVFEESRRRQVCVMLARLPGVDETVQAVSEMDDCRLNRDQVELLLANAPPAEELAALRSAAAETEHETEEPLDWDDAEAFILKLSVVPSFTLRLQTWAFENSFDERFDIFQQAVSDVRSACSALRDSPHIQRLLALALSVGNYMNAGTARGRADGFTIEALAQMRTVKASTPGLDKTVFTLVDYIVQQLERSRPGELEGLFTEHGEAQTVRKAARHKLADLNLELNTYYAQADGLVKRTASSQDDELDIRGLRVESRLHELGVLQKLFVQTEDEFRLVCTWFYEGTGQKRERTSDEFFGVWDGFLEAVRVAVESVYGRRAREKKNVNCHRSFQKLKRSLSVADVPTSALQLLQKKSMQANGDDDARPRTESSIVTFRDRPSIVDNDTEDEIVDGNPRQWMRRGSAPL